MKQFILIAGILTLGASGAASYAPAYADEMEEYKAIYRATQICKELLGDISKVNWDDQALMMRVEECFEANGVMNDRDYSRAVGHNHDQMPGTVTQMGGASSSATAQPPPVILPDKDALTRRLQGQRPAAPAAAQDSQDIDSHDAAQTPSSRGGVYVPTVRGDDENRNKKEDSGPKPVYIGR